MVHRKVKYLYDGDCAMCRSLKAVLERQDNRKGLISFIDISGVSWVGSASRAAY